MIDTSIEGVLREIATGLYHEEEADVVANSLDPIFGLRNLDGQGNATTKQVLQIKNGIHFKQ